MLSFMNSKEQNSQLPLLVATALGVHNVGEGFAIAAALLSGFGLLR